MTIDMTYERQLELAAIEYKEAGMAEGLATGIIEGVIKGQKIMLISNIQKKVLKNKSLEQIADELEEDIEMIRPVYNSTVANKDKTAEEIYSLIFG